MRPIKPKEKVVSRNRIAQIKPPSYQCRGQAVEYLSALLRDSFSAGPTLPKQGLAIIRQLQRHYGTQNLRRFISEEIAESRKLIQPKLMVGPAGDKYEREADRVASAVMAFLSSYRAKSPVGTHLPGDKIHRKQLIWPQVSAEGGVVERDVEAAIRFSKGGGRSLPSGLRTEMERAFGADFHHVRIHTGVTPHRLNQRLGSGAFTTGKDIFFRKGSYRFPGDRGKEILAHELTHVIQQGQR